MTSTAFDIAWSPGDALSDDTVDGQSEAGDRTTQGGGMPRARVLLWDCQKQSMLDFGSVSTRSPNDEGEEASHEGVLELVNENESIPVHVQLDRFMGAKHGFTIEDGEWTVPPGSSVEARVVWQPRNAGGVRQSVALSFLNPAKRRMRVGAFLTGVAVGAENAPLSRRPSRPAKKGKPGRENSAALQNKASGPLRERSPNQPLDAPTLVKRPAESEARQAAKPRPAARPAARRAPGRTLSLQKGGDAKHEALKRATRQGLKESRVLYDGKWMEKQDKGFAAWLNFVMNPDLDVAEGEAGGITANPLALLAHKQRQAALLRAAYSVYHSREMERVAFLVDREISTGGIAIREDRDLFKDLGLRTLVLDLLFKYNLAWLRLGLETVLGMQMPSSERALKRTIVTHMLGDPELDEAFKDTKKGLFDENPEYKREARHRTLRRFLMLVLFLDRAKRAGVLDHPGCLFRPDADVKSSADMLIAFTKEFLSGEGNVIRHLQHACEYVVDHRQTVLDEYDYRVNNLATDLRDGVRLMRAVELLTNDKERALSRQARVPSISKLQKKHNVEVALRELERQGVDLATAGGRLLPGGKLKERICSNDIVDGHRQKTLALLWKMIAKWKVSIILPQQVIRGEIERVRELHGPTAAAIFAKSKAQQEQQTLQEPASGPMDEALAESTEAVAALIIEWCQAVCAHHGVRVSNLTTSMASGRALGLLIHHYHPMLLTRESIRPTVVDACLAAKPGCVAKDMDWIPFDTALLSRQAFKAACANERANFALANDCASALGCVPVILPPHDTENVPEAKGMLLFLAYLCSRLVSLRDEIVAASRIQRVWRSLRRTERLRELSMCSDLAATKIGSVARGFLVRNSRRRAAAAVAVQTSFRGAVLRRRFAQLRASAIRIQAVYRGSVVLACYVLVLESAIFVQAIMRGFLSRRRSERIAVQQASAVAIQAQYRGKLVRRSLARQATAATTVQSTYRALRARDHYRRVRQAAVKLQAIARAAAVRSRADFADVRASAVRLQSVARCWVARAKLRRARGAAIMVQTAFRRHRVQQDYLVFQDACVVVQCVARGFPRRSSFVRQRLAARAIQAQLRGAAQRRKLVAFRSAATRLQAAGRMWQERRSFQLQRASAATVQSVARGVAARRSWARTRRAVCLLQASVRGVEVRAQVARRAAAAGSLQQWWRMAVLRRDFALASAAVVRVQSLARVVIARNSRDARLAAGRRVQSFARMATTRIVYLHCRDSVVDVQACARRWLARRALARSVAAATCVQARVRQWSAKQKLARFRRAVVAVQAHWRREQVQRVVFAETRAAVTLQAWQRASVCRVCFQAQRAAAVLVQALARGGATRRDYVATRAALVTVQSFGRMAVARRAHEARIAAVVTMQACARQALARARFTSARQAATVIQALGRRRAAAKSLAEARQAATCLQAAARRRSAMLRLAVAQRGFVKLQAALRARSARTSYLAVLESRRSASAAKLQAVARMIVARALLRQQREAVVALQVVVRGTAARAQLRKARQLAEAGQRIGRGFRARRECACRRRAVCRLQAAARLLLAQKRLRDAKIAATAMQTLWRKHQAQSALAARLRAVTVAQATARGFLARRACACRRSAVWRLQAAARSLLAQKRLRDAKAAAIAMQTLWRKHQAQSVLAARLRAVTVVQATARGRLARAQLAEAKAAAAAIQALARGRCARLEADKQRSQILRVQATARRWLATKALAQQQIAATRIQAMARMAPARFGYQRQVAQVRIAQAAARRRAARAAFVRIKTATRLLQHFARRYCVEDKRHVVALTRFQACVRGWLVRQQRSRELQEVEQRLTKASENVTESQTLGGRTRSALDWILRSKDLAHVLKACTTLQVCTKASRECAESFLESDASDVLFALIRSCNRSEPHVKVLEVALTVLVQVAARDTARVYGRLFAAADAALLALVDLLQIFRDKPRISSLALRLLELYCDDSRRVQVHLQADSDEVKRLLSIEQILHRKCDVMRHNRNPATAARGRPKEPIERRIHSRLKHLLQRVLSTS